MERPPKRSDNIVENNKPSRRMATWMESCHRKMDAIDDLTGTPTNTELEDKVNELLAALRTTTRLDE